MTIWLYSTHSMYIYPQVVTILKREKNNYPHLLMVPCMELCKYMHNIL